MIPMGRDGVSWLRKSRIVRIPRKSPLFFLDFG